MHFLYYAAVIAILCRCLTKEEIFREPREWLTSLHRDTSKHPLVRKLAYMPTCEFCSSFWVTFVLLYFLFDYRLLHNDWRGYVVATFVTMGVANIYMSLFNLIQIDVRQERVKTEKIEKEVERELQ